MRQKTDIFKVLSEPNRIRILMMLLDRTLCVCEITAVLELSTATVSNHLSYLREKGFILDEKEGKWINYRINDNPRDPMVVEILTLLPKWFADDATVKSDIEKLDLINRMSITCS